MVCFGHVWPYIWAGIGFEVIVSRSNWNRVNDRAIRIVSSWRLMATVSGVEPRLIPTITDQNADPDNEYLSVARRAKHRECCCRDLVRRQPPWRAGRWR